MIIGNCSRVIRRWGRQFCACVAGTAALEAAIVLPVGISVVAGGIEFGHALSTYQTVVKSVRSATRYLARVPPAYICSGSWGFSRAQNLAVYGSLSGGTTPLVTGWTVTSVTLLKPTTCPPTTTDVVVQLQAVVRYNGVILSVIPGLSNQLNFTVRHEERLIKE
jgi:Flp pilus assembly protein TadG